MNASNDRFRTRAVIETPCIKVCKIDETTQLCTGCHRSLDEIVRWGSMPAAERRAIMNDLASRAKKV